MQKMIGSDEALCDLFEQSRNRLSGPQRRHFMGEVVNAVGDGGQRWAESILGWSRTTIRKAQQELANHSTQIKDQVHLRGRRPIENHIPTLCDDIREIADRNSCQDPTFDTTQVYCRLSAKSVRNELLSTYPDDQLPSVRTIRTKLNRLNFPPTKVAKSKVIKKIPQTDAIFEQVHKVNAQADQTKGVLRLSMDAKAAIKVGPYSRGGRSRRKLQGADHDFQPKLVLKLFGIFLPHHNQPYFYFNESKVTPDMMVDCLEQIWTSLDNQYHVEKLVINLDNGPENHSGRTQFIKRMVDFATTNRVEIYLAYYPPYHSKYNPIERVWGVLENHWNGELLDSREKILMLAESMTWNGNQPVVQENPAMYETGKTLSKEEMARYESQLERHQGLEKWFVRIRPTTIHTPDCMSQIPR
jgi:hypothetical protein